MSAGVSLKNGQRWEFLSRPFGTTTEYELESFGNTFYGSLARLRNVETDGIAHVSCRWLYEGENQRGQRSAWRLAEHQPEPVAA